MPGRRYSDGLHQAIEAKEHVKVKRESKTLATITFQNFFNPHGIEHADESLGAEQSHQVILEGNIKFGLSGI